MSTLIVPTDPPLTSFKLSTDQLKSIKTRKYPKFVTNENKPYFPRIWFATYTFITAGYVSVDSLLTIHIKKKDKKVKYENWFSTYEEKKKLLFHKIKYHTFF